MNASKISVRYAKALFEVAVESNSINNVYSELILLADIIKDNKEFYDFFCSPNITISKKKEFINKILSKHFSKTTIKFLFKIIENKRENLLPDIIRNFQKLYNEYNNIIEVNLITAHSISQSTEEEIIKYLQNRLNKKVKLKKTIDEKIIGGFIIQIDDKEYNATISEQLNKIKEKLNY